MNAHLHMTPGQRIVVKKEPITIKQEVTEANTAVQCTFQTNQFSNELEMKVNALSTEKDKLIADLLLLKSENQRLYFDIKNKERLEQKLNADLSHQKNENDSLLKQLNNNNIVLKQVKIDKLHFESELKKQQMAMELLLHQQQMSYSELKKKYDRTFKENKTLSARVNQIQSSTAAAAEADVSDRNAYSVKNIINHKKKNKTNYFLVRWEGFNSKYDTWEPESNLKHLSVYKKYIKHNKI